MDTPSTKTRALLFRPLKTTKMTKMAGVTHAKTLFAKNPVLALLNKGSGALGEVKSSCCPLGGAPEELYDKDPQALYGAVYMIESTRTIVAQRFASANHLNLHKLGRMCLQTSPYRFGSRVTRAN